MIRKATSQVSRQVKTRSGVRPLTRREISAVNGSAQSSTTDKRSQMFDMLRQIIDKA